MEFPEPIYSVGLDGNPEYDTDHRADRLHLAGHARLGLRLRPGHPDDDAAQAEAGARAAIDPDDYEQHREWAVADDGTRVPISIVGPQGHARATAPRRCVLYGYGSYEISMDPWFSIARLSLLDRGVVFAVAHIRGGGEMGRRWYEDGKMLAKKNTFTDFVACARAPGRRPAGRRADRLVARGGSAGGLLMGAVANLAPDAFAGIVAQVPFVDPLNSILDPSLPLTVTEWEEWGNPLETAEVYAYMKSYTPVRERGRSWRYPAILAVTSLNDTRVLYHEPAKWIARLRAGRARTATTC